MKSPLKTLLALLSLFVLTPALAQETDFLIDERDNNIYLVMKFNDHWWMCQNLKYDAGEGSFCYDDDETNCLLKGRWYTYNTALKACPQGYRLPSDDEWKALEAFIGMDLSDLDQRFNRNSGRVGKFLKAGGGIGFDAEFAGVKNPTGRDSYIDTHAYFWTSSERDASSAWARVMQDSKEGIDRQIITKNYGLSVRCIKNAPGDDQ